MKIYVVLVQQTRFNNAFVSQEAYSTLEAAQDFCERRYNTEKVTDYLWTSNEYMYTISEVTVK
jgi:hypothetical protein